MTDRPEPMRTFETPPTRLRARRRDPVPVLVAIGAVLFVVVAVVKPWGGSVPDASPAPSVPVPSPTPARTVGPVYQIALVERSPDVDGRSASRASAPGDPVEAATSLVAEIATHAGTWGIGAGGWDRSRTGRTDWTSWHPTTPKGWDDPAVLLGYADRDRACATDQSLRTDAAVLAVTSPLGVTPDWVVKGWVVGADGTTVVAPRIVRVTPPTPGRGGLSAIAFADGSLWADGVYRLLVQGGGGRLAIDVCLGSDSPESGQAPAEGPVSGPSDEVVQAITRGLVGRSGEWGIGVGGPDAGTSGAWVAWRAATPTFGDRSIELRPPPSCRASDARSIRIRPGIVVALTVPTDLPPDWIAEAVRFDGRGRASFDDLARQASPAGNRGIAYLYRSDGSAWPDGPYQFRIMTSTQAAIVDACLASP